jgi:hypothetical protein
MANIFKNISIEMVSDVLLVMKKNDTAVIRVSGKDRDRIRKYNIHLNLGIEDTRKIFGEGIVETE